MSYKKLKKKQLIQLIIERDNEIQHLKEQLSILKNSPPKIVEVIKEIEVIKEEEKEIEMDDEDKFKVDFLKNQVESTIYPKMKKIYQSELNRILNRILNKIEH